MEPRSKLAARFGLALLLLAIAAGVGATPPAPAKQVWDFEGDEPGKLAQGFSSEAGRWAVVAEAGHRVLAQQAESGDDTFNLALVAGTSARDLDLSVRIKAVAGKDDRGGGLVWRAKDARNYYIARYNPLEANFRAYKVEAGRRTMLRDAKVPGDGAWHTLRVTMVGPKITCDLDGKRHLEAEDSTFPEAGRVGLWSKADARSYFDDLTLAD